jgi:hypothetical protein
VDEIRTYLQQQKPLGSKRFRAWVESRAGRFATARAPGRPSHREIVPGTLAVGDGARVPMTMPPSSGTGS